MRLTNKVGLPRLHGQDDEADHAGQSRNDTEREREVDSGLVLFPHAWEEEEGKGVDWVKASVKLPEISDGESYRRRRTTNSWQS